MSFDLVFFGGTGDLTWRKLMPALFQAFRHGKLPPGGHILSVAREELSDTEYRAWLKARFQEVEVAKRPSDDEFARFVTGVGRACRSTFARASASQRMKPRSSTSGPRRTTSSRA